MTKNYSTVVLIFINSATADLKCIIKSLLNLNSEKVRLLFCLQFVKFYIFLVVS